MELLTSLARQFITDTDNDGQIDPGEVMSSLTSLLSGTDGNLQPDLGSIVTNLQQAGLSDIAASWLGDGENLPITPDQIREVLNPERMQAFASALNLDPGTVEAGLSGLIPVLVDRSSSAGQLNDASDLLAAGLRKLF